MQLTSLLLLWLWAFFVTITKVDIALDCDYLFIEMVFDPVSCIQDNLKVTEWISIPSTECVNPAVMTNEQKQLSKTYVK